MATLTKATLAANLEKEVGIDNEFALTFVEHFFEEIMQVLEQGEEVKLSGLGKLCVRQKKARPGLNPKTKEYVPITPRIVVTFCPGASLKKKLTHPGKS